MQLDVGAWEHLLSLSLPLRPYFISTSLLLFILCSKETFWLFSMFMSRAFSKPDGIENPEKVTNFGLTPCLIVELNNFLNVMPIIFFGKLLKFYELNTENVRPVHLLACMNPMIHNNGQVIGIRGTLILCVCGGGGVQPIFDEMYRASFEISRM
jgi:hypothetical protein